MGQPKRLMVRVEDITFEDCEAAAGACGRYKAEEEIETYAHELLEKSSEYELDSYINDCGWDEMSTNESGWRVLPASVWLAWLDEVA